jgi:hypothetical protein
MKMNNKARAYIFRHVRSEYLGDIRTLKTVKECWKALEDVHGRSMDIVLSMQELGSIVKTTGMDVSAYCRRMQDLCDKLSSVSIKIEDHVMACFLLAGLAADPNYATHLGTTRIDKDLTTRNVKSDLLPEERRIDAAADSAVKNGAMAARTQWWTPTQQNRDGARPKQRDPKDQKCYKCGKRGHISYQCPEGKENKEMKNQREIRRQEESRRERESEDDSRSKGLISTLALSSISHMERDRISYLDSGASNHMTPDRHRFVDLVPATGQIRIGKGYLEVNGKGMIVVKMAKSCGGWTLSLSNALWVPELYVNLISIRQLATKGVTTVFIREKAVGTHYDGDTMVVFNQRWEIMYTI